MTTSLKPMPNHILVTQVQANYSDTDIKHGVCIGIPEMPYEFGKINVGDRVYFTNATEIEADLYILPIENVLVYGTPPEALTATANVIDVGVSDNSSDFELVYINDARHETPETITEVVFGANYTSVGYIENEYLGDLPKRLWQAMVTIGTVASYVDPETRVERRVLLLLEGLELLNSDLVLLVINNAIQSNQQLDPKTQTKRAFKTFYRDVLTPWVSSFAENISKRHTPEGRA